MLVLSRKSQQAVVVGGSDGFERLLKVIVLSIEGNKVRLGFGSRPKFRSIAWKCGSESARTPSLTPRRKAPAAIQ
jgi:hypothetical protein